MNAQQALTLFAQKCLSAEKARRFTELSSTKKGQRKILEGLCHEFERAVLPGAVQSGGYDRLWVWPCFAFHPSLGFGREFSSTRETYDQLSVADGWLIILRDGSAGIHRPEGRWDGEKLIVG